MVITGDLASFEEFKFEAPLLSKSEKLIVNLEGTVTNNDKKWKDKMVVYNSISTIDYMKENHNLVGVVLANNHCYDIPKVYKNLFANKNLGECGTGKLGEKIRPLVVKEKEETYVIYAFCWNITGARMAKKSREGTYPIKKELLLECINNARKEYPKAHYIVTFHWGIELEKYPEPMHIEMAHYAIDIGFDLVIGHHPHRIQPIEEYKNKYIFYSIGNFYIQPNYYFNGKLSYPSCANKGLMVCIDGKQVNCIQTVSENGYVSTEKVYTIEEAMSEFGCREMNSEYYAEWFRKNREKKMLLPIYNKTESFVSNYVKDTWIKVRGLIIIVLCKLNVKKKRGYK